MIKRPKRHSLITPPIEWMMTAAPVHPPAIPVIAERGGTQLRTPKPILIIDTREQEPFDFSHLSAWFKGIERKALKLGDYSVAGMEDVCVIERKSLPDLVHSLTAERKVFIERLRRMSVAPHRLLVIESAWSQVKSRYEYSNANPNQISQSLIAILTGLGVPFICSETRELGAEIVASFAYQTHLYNWLECNGHDRCLSDLDL